MVIQDAPVVGVKGGYLLYGIGLLLLLVLTLFLYQDVRNFSFLNYDDVQIVTDNTDIHDCSLSGLWKIFMAPQNPAEMIPPLTVYTFALNYHFSELEPGAYHLTNLLIHLLNIVLVFLLILKVSGNRMAALFTAAVLALHPSHSEAVAWVSARKELLYTSFYILALMAAIRFWKYRNWWYYLLALALFILSYYAKYAAAAFPLLYLILALFWKNRKDYGRVSLETLPFLLLPLYSFYLSLSASWEGITIFRKAENIAMAGAEVAGGYHIPPSGLNNVFSLGQKFILSGYSFIQYLLKFILPLEQQIIYPYPVLSASGAFPVVYYACAGIAFLLVAAIVFLFYKNRHTVQAPIRFGLVFFLAPLILLLHFLPIGGRVIVADRYSYMLFIGLGLLLFYVLEWLSARLKKPVAGYTAMILYLAVLVFYLHKRIPDWQNSQTIFSDQIAKDPGYTFGYVNLAVYHIDAKQYQDAEKLLHQASALDPFNFITYFNLGIVSMKTSAWEQSILNFEKAKELDPRNFLVYYHLGHVHMQTGNLAKAKAMLDTSLLYNSRYAPAKINLGVVLVQMHQYEAAIPQLKQAIAENPGVAAAHDALGVAYLELNRPEEALPCFDQAVALQQGYYLYLLHQCAAVIRLKRYEEALAMSENLIRLNAANGMGFYYRGLAKWGIGNIQDGCPDIRTAYQMGVTEITNNIMESCR